MSQDRTWAAGAGAERPRARALHVYAVFTVVATLLLITAGGLVTSTGSGLSVPDWPLSYGMLFPPMVGGILYEHGHRMVATTIGILTIVLAVWLAKSEPRRWVRRLGLLALAAVIAQGLLGGLTVLLLLPTAVSMAHACVAQAFFCTLVTIAVVTSPAWERAGSAAARAPGADSHVSPQLLTLAATTTAVIYCQLILGALTRHTKAGLAISDFPLANGRLIPDLGVPLVAIQFVHRLGALVVATLVVATAVRAARERRALGGAATAALLLLPLVAAQILLGAITVGTRLAVVPATAHVTTGAALLGVSLIFTLMSHRRARFAISTPRAAAPTLVGRTATT